MQLTSQVEQMLLYQYLINLDLEYCKVFLKKCLGTQNINLRIPLSAFTSKIMSLNREVIKKLESDNQRSFTKRFKKYNKTRC